MSNQRIDEYHCTDALHKLVSLTAKRSLKGIKFLNPESNAIKRN